MYDCPISMPTPSQYEALGVRPDATAEELRDAMSEAVGALRSEKKSVEAELEFVRQAVPGLREAIAEVERLQLEGGADRVAAAGRTLTRLEGQAAAVNPRYRELCAREREIGEEILRINRMALQNSAERLEYDRLNPPFELLKLADCTRDELADPLHAAAALREEITTFLAARGEAVFHPSDLTRTDFTGDFTPNPLLDGPG